MTPSLPVLDDVSFDRLRRTSVFRGNGFPKWQETVLGVVGAGVLGFRFTTEAILSGPRRSRRTISLSANARTKGLNSPARGYRKSNRWSRLATPSGRVASSASRSTCATRAWGELARLSMLVDCSDDAAPVPLLTRLSNGLGIPLLRLAVDGSGELEMGRVLCSHGGAGCACQICTYDFQDLFRPTRRTPCPGQPDSERPPTITGGALAAAIGGFGLVQAQRLATGNDVERVVNREIVLDMTHWGLFPIERRRSETCLSGHVRWQLTPIGRSAEGLTFAELFAEAQRRLGNRRVTLEPVRPPFVR